MKTMTITIERKPLTIQFDGKEMQVEELGIRLPFGRKPATIMHQLAKGYSDEQIRLLANYFATQKP